MSRFGWREALVVWLAMSGIAYYVFAPALHGPLLADDYVYFVGRPYMDALTPANVLAILDPQGDPVILTWNYAPVHLLAHAAMRALFGSFSTNTYPHHLLNVLMHGLNATLLLALLAAYRVPLAAAGAGALLFLLHPANVEAVAWIFELKTLLSFAFGIGALLCLVRRPLVASLLFACGLLTKPTAAGVLAAAVVFEWLRAPGPSQPSRRTPWLVLWALMLGAYSLPEFGGFESFNLQLGVRERILSAVAIVGRYVVLALTTIGSSTFHQPTPTESVLDPWFLLGAAALLGLGAASLLALWRRHPAAPWLGLAAASYAPVSQVFAFRYPMADRYLYFVLPGLLGAALVTLTPSLEAAWARLRRSGVRAAPGLIALAVGTLAVSAAFAVRGHERAVVFGSEDLFDRDALLNYPDGVGGKLAQARAALKRGDESAALDDLEAAHRQGYRGAVSMMHDPDLARLHGNPRFTALSQAMARDWLAQFERLPRVLPDALVDLFQYQLLLEENDEAFATLAKLESMPDRVDPRVVRRLRQQAEETISRREREP